MILIEEKTPKKIPGITSLFVSFDKFSSDVVAALKSCSPYNYDKHNKVWEIPTTRLSKLVNTVHSMDDIEIRLAKDKKYVEPEVYRLSRYKTKPYPYQEEGIQFGLNHDNFLLLDAPGLGKSLQIIYLAQEIKKREKIKHCLIVCGLNTLKTNWEKEITKHSDLDCVILGKHISKTGSVTYGSVKDRLNQLKKPIKEFFVITNIETLRDNEVLAELKSGRNTFDMVVLDECHVVKSPTSQQGKNFLKLNTAKHKIGLTGTLLLNNPLDAYVPLKWIGMEHSNYSNFKYQYCEFGGVMGREFLGFKHVDVIKEQIAQCSLRRTKELLDLPEKTIIDEYIDMSSSQSKFYSDIKSGVLEDVDKVTIKSTNLLALIARLRQATACPSILTTENIPSAKIDRCCELVDEITSSGNKVVVFSTFKQTLYELEKLLSDYNPLVCTGDISDDVISRNIDKFQNDNEHGVLLATHQKMGTGITLNRASYAIFLDTPFTSGAYEQACDRIHRIGSKDPVFIYNLICNNTFDERVHDIVESKAVISDYVIDDTIDQRTFDILKKFILELK